MWQNSTRSNPANSGCDPSATNSHDRRAIKIRPLKALLLEDDSHAREGIISSIRRTPAEVQCVSTVTAALFALDHDSFDVIVIDRDLGGWVSAQACRDLVAKAGHIPVVGLINQDCVLDLQDGIEAGLTGVYYKDEMNVRLMRRLGRLAYLPSVDAPLAETSTRELVQSQFGSGALKWNY
jgi:DNA-binding NarL/FixJ family response regulator